MKVNELSTKVAVLMVGAWLASCTTNSSEDYPAPRFPDFPADVDQQSLIEAARDKYGPVRLMVGFGSVPIIDGSRKLGEQALSRGLKPPRNRPLASD